LEVSPKIKFGKKRNVLVSIDIYDAYNRFYEFILDIHTFFKLSYEIPSKP